MVLMVYAVGIKHGPYGLFRGRKHSPYGLCRGRKA